MSNLARVLKDNTKGITLENLATLQKLLVQHGLATNSFYLSGSTVVQACLGVLWDRGHNAKTDVDIFCTHDAAPIIRSWLVNINAGGPGNHIFSGAKFGSLDQSHFLVQESPINHVEEYGLFTSIAQPPVGTVSIDQQQLHIQNEESVKTAIQFGMAKQTRHLQNGICVSTHSNDPIPFLPKDTIENLYRMEQDDGIYFKKTVDLVVAKNTCSSAEDLLQNFDLEICSCSFDGVKFKIPSPHSVFKNKSNPSSPFFLQQGIPVKSLPQNAIISLPSTTARSRLDCLKSFFLPIIGNHAAEDTTLDIIRHLRDVMPFHPFATYVFFNEDANGSTKFTRAYFIHTFIQCHVLRIAKYRRRGVNIIGTEMIPSQYDLPSGVPQHHLVDMHEEHFFQYY